MCRFEPTSDLLNFWNKNDIHKTVFYLRILVINLYGLEQISDVTGEHFWRAKAVEERDIWRSKADLCYRISAPSLSNGYNPELFLTACSSPYSVKGREIIFRRKMAAPLTGVPLSIQFLNNPDLSSEKYQLRAITIH